MTTKDDEHDRLARRLMDEGRLLEAGWHALARLAVPPDAPEVQRRDMRWAFLAGAQHLFAAMMGGLDPDSEPTAADLRRMDLIAKELDVFGQELTAAIEKQGQPRP
jgi:hypothetical protein